MKQLLVIFILLGVTSTIASTTYGKKVQTGQSTIRQAQTHQSIKRSISQSNIVLSTASSPTPINSGMLTAIQYGASIVSTLLNITDPILISIQLDDIQANVLGITTAWTGTPFADPRLGISVFLSNALARQLVGPPVNPPGEDARIVFSNSINYYLGLDGRPASDEFDLVSVTIHELLHGLGMVSFIDNMGVNTLTVNPSQYDAWIADDAGTRITTLSDAEVMTASINFMEFDWTIGATAQDTAGFPQAPILFTPSAYTGGASISHLDTDTYSDTPEIKAVLPVITSGESFHHTGGTPLLMLQTMGYNIRDCTQFTSCSECQANFCGWCESSSSCGDPFATDVPALFGASCPHNFAFDSCSVADLRLRFDATNSPVDNGDESRFNFNVTNVGPDIATNLQILFDLPPEASSSSIVLVPSLAACDIYDENVAPFGHTQIECTFTSLNAMETIEFVLRVVINGPEGDYTVMVTGSAAEIDDTANDRSAVTQIIGVQPSSSTTTSSSSPSDSDDGLDLSDFSDISNPLLWVVVGIIVLILACIVLFVLFGIVLCILKGVFAVAKGCCCYDKTYNY